MCRLRNCEGRGGGHGEDLWKSLQEAYNNDVCFKYSYFCFYPFKKINLQPRDHDNTLNRVIVVKNI